MDRGYKRPAFNPSRPAIMASTMRFGKVVAIRFRIGLGVTVYRVLGFETVSAVFTASPILSGGSPFLPLAIMKRLSRSTAGA